MELPAAQSTPSARCLFDEMHQGSKNEASKQAATTAGGEDRLSALPDAILHHVLSFLPSYQAVRTCVLARRWRHQWKPVPALRVEACEFRTPKHLLDFVNHLLLLRDRAPLRECDIGSHDGRDVSPWILYALLFRVRVLRVNLSGGKEYMLPNVTLISEQLVRLELRVTHLKSRSLDFSSCPTLKVVKIANSIIMAKKIVSQSLRHLSITECFWDLGDHTRGRISAPSLISLEFDSPHGFTPVLERMPSLVTAYLKLWIGSYDRSNSNMPRLNSHDSVLVDGLSNATDLVLMTLPEVFIFRKDFKTRPLFSKLKTLLLDGWCVAGKCSALVYFLQHSPVLEKLTLQLYRTCKSISETDGSCYEREQLLASKYLKVVEVKYCQDDMPALTEVLKILTTCGVPSRKVSIGPSTSWASDRFNFEQTVKLFSC